MKEVSPSFVVDNRNRKLLAELYNYVWKLGGGLDPTKGLLFHGPIGTGKSTLLKGLQKYLAKINRYCYAYEANISFRFTSAVEIALIYAKKGLDGLTDFTEKENMYNLAIDEIGKEPMDSKHFGTNLNVIQTILQLRYEEKHKCLTHITTNLDPNTEFSGLYGDYIADRVKEMFNVIALGGDSRRC